MQTSYSNSVTDISHVKSLILIYVTKWIIIKVLSRTQKLINCRSYNKNNVINKWHVNVNHKYIICEQHSFHICCDVTISFTTDEYLIISLTIKITINSVMWVLWESHVNIVLNFSICISLHVFRDDHMAWEQVTYKRGNNVMIMSSLLSKQRHSHIYTVSYSENLAVFSLFLY